MDSRAIDLADGRTLAWREFGAAGGWPLVAVHGSPDSSAIWALLDEAAGRAGAWVIAPDRPGFGQSTPKPDRSILDWVDDLDELADHLDIGAFPLLAISGGSPYALAVAAARPDRLDRVGLLSVISPLDAPGVTSGANPQVRFTFWAARRAPFLLKPMGRLMAMLTRKFPNTAAERMIGTRPPADREIIRRPEVMAVLRENLPNQFRHPESMALEMRNAARPWGFELSEVTVPATIWQGGLDDVHTPAMGRYLADQLPNAELIYEPRYATFNFIDDFDTILDTLTAHR